MEKREDVRISMETAISIFHVINEYQEELERYTYVFGRQVPPRIKRMVDEIHLDLERAIEAVPGVLAKPVK